MLSIKFSHGQYQSFVQSFLTHYFNKTGQGITIVLRANLILKLWIADLTGIVNLIRDGYCNSPSGTPPKDLVALLRSLILMTLCGETSIAKWVNTLRTEPFYAILSGFIPACHDLSALHPLNAETLPGVGTFYDIMDRLISKDRTLTCPDSTNPGVSMLIDSSSIPKLITPFILIGPPILYKDVLGYILSIYQILFWG